MPVRIKYPTILYCKIPKISFWSCLIFGYFFTLHADQLSIKIADFNFRLNNLIAILLALSLSVSPKQLLCGVEKKTLFYLSLLAVSFFISTLTSYDYMRTLSYFLMGIFTLFFYFLLPYLLVMNLEEKKILSLYFSSFMAVGIYGLWQFSLGFFGMQDTFTPQKIDSLNRANAFAAEPSYYALYFTPYIAITLSTYLLNCTIAAKAFLNRQITLKNLVFINILFLASTASSAFFAYFVYVFLLLLLGFSKQNRLLKLNLKKIAILLILLLSSTTLILIFSGVNKEVFIKFFISGIKHNSFNERWRNIMNSYHVFLEHPVFGVGLGSVRSYIYDAYYKPFSEYLGSHLNPVTLPTDLEPANVFTEILASLGCFGLVTFALFFMNYLSFFKKLFKLPTMGIPDKKWGMCLLLSTLTMLICLQFNGGVFRTYIWVHLALTQAYVNKQLATMAEEHSNK